MIKVMIHGCNGKMGQVLSEAILYNEEIEVVCGIDQNVSRHINLYPVFDSISKYEQGVDCIIDFSHPTYLEDLLTYAKSKNAPLIIATTGFNEHQISQIKEAANQIPILLSSNLSLGVNIINRVLRDVSELLQDYDIEIIEKHHNRKIDAPSGTAYLLANTINETLPNKREYVFGRFGQEEKRGKEIGIHAIRGGTINGEHDVIFAGSDEIIEFKHTALSKQIFAKGAILATKKIIYLNNGLLSMDDILFTK